MIQAVATTIVMLVGVSMSPTYTDGSYFWGCKATEIGCYFNDVSIGDVVYFQSTQGQVMHRVVDIQHDLNGNNYLLITRGDNPITNSISIPEVDEVTQAEYKGTIISEWVKVEENLVI